MQKATAQSESPRRHSRKLITADVTSGATAAAAHKAGHLSDAAMHAAEAPRKTPRFRIFIVDSGWNSAARKALHDNFHLIRELQQETPIYFLGRERSVELLRRYPVLVGKDPIIRVHCDVKREHRKPGFHGFRLHLGLLKKPEQALLALQNFVKFISVHRDSEDLEADMRKKLRQEGLQGAFEIVMNGEAHSIGI